MKNRRILIICSTLVSLIVTAIFIYVTTVLMFDISMDEETGKTTVVVVHDPFSDFIYEVYDDHVVLLLYTDNKKTVNIPDTLWGKPVTEIGQYCFSESAYLYVKYAEGRDDYESQIQTVKLGKNIEYIGFGAFMPCEYLKKVQGDNTISMVDEAAFSACCSLEIFEPKMIRIEEEAFDGCYELKDINKSSNITYIGRRAFLACYSLKDIGSQPDLEYVGDGAFCNSGLEKFQGSEDTKFGRGVFTYTPYLENTDIFVLNDILMNYVYDEEKPYIVFPQNATIIDEESITGDMSNLEEIYFPDTVTEIRCSLFNMKAKNKNSLTFYIPDSVTTIGYTLDSGTHVGIDYDGAKIVTTEGSYAQHYAREHGMICEIVDEIVMPE